MNEGLRRFLVLLGVFLLAFLAVFVVRRVQGGEGIFDVFRLGPTEARENFVPEEYTLSTEPALEPDDVKWLMRLDAEYAKLTAAVVPSVVSLRTEGSKARPRYDFWGKPLEPRRFDVSGFGSGVIVTKQGHVVTNQHVITGKSDLRVTLHDGTTYPAILIGEDPVLDIAVLRIKAKDREFQPLTFGDSDRVSPGQHAFAIGNPFGLGETITKGIISAKERAISDKQRDLFQTDAAINPGNSGGPLVNIFGDIIAINLAIYATDAVQPGFVGIGFSIPSNDVREVFEQIVERGRVIRGWLGVQSYDWEPRWRFHSGYEGEGGAFIFDVVSNSPAEKAGLEPFDVVLSYDETPVESRLHFFSLIQGTEVGKEVPMRVWRDGSEIQLIANVIDADEADSIVQEEPAPRSASDQKIINDIGLSVQRLGVLHRTRGDRGVLVDGVLPGSQAHAKGIRRYDLILAINKVRINSPPDFYARLVASAAVQSTTLVVQRGRKIYRVELEAVERTSEDPER